MKAAKSNSNAMLNVGYLLYYGMGVPQSIEKAAYYYTKAMYKDSVEYILSSPDEDVNSYCNEEAKEWHLKIAENYYSSCNGEMKRSSNAKDIFE